MGIIDLPILKLKVKNEGTRGTNYKQGHFMKERATHG